MKSALTSSQHLGHILQTEQLFLCHQQPVLKKNQRALINLTANESFTYRRNTFIKKSKHSYHPAFQLPSEPHLHTCNAQMQNHENHPSFTTMNNIIIYSQFCIKQVDIK